MEALALTYLDTHAAVWLYAGEYERFPAPALDEIENASLAVSPMVLFEIQMLREVRRISAGPDEVLGALGRDIGLKLCDLPFADIARMAVRETWTRDPFDRIIVAHARAGDGKLLSKDREIQIAFPGAVWSTTGPAFRH